MDWHQMFLFFKFKCKGFPELHTQNEIREEFLLVFMCTDFVIFQNQINKYCYNKRKEL